MRFGTYSSLRCVNVAVVSIKLYHKSTNQIQMITHKGTLPAVNVIKNLRFLKIEDLGRNELFRT